MSRGCIDSGNGKSSFVKCLERPRTKSLVNVCLLSAHVLAFVHFQRRSISTGTATASFLGQELIQIDAQVSGDISANRKAQHAIRSRNLKRSSQRISRRCLHRNFQHLQQCVQANVTLHRVRHLMMPRCSCFASSIYLMMSQRRRRPLPWEHSVLLNFIPILGPLFGRSLPARENVEL